MDLSNYIKQKTKTKHLYKYKGNYANQAKKVKKLVHWAKVRGRDPKEVRVRYSQDDSGSDSWMESQSALSESDDDYQINDEYFIEKAMKEAVQTRI